MFWVSLYYSYVLCIRNTCHVQPAKEKAFLCDGFCELNKSEVKLLVCHKKADGCKKEQLLETLILQMVVHILCAESYFQTDHITTECWE